MADNQALLFDIHIWYDGFPIAIHIKLLPLTPAKPQAATQAKYAFAPPAPFYVEIQTNGVLFLKKFHFFALFRW